MYKYRGYYIPERMMPRIERYVQQGVIPGNFLQAVICNNLKETFAFADDENTKNIAAYVGYFYNEVPSKAWGSHKIMMKWAKDGGLEGGK